MALINCPECKKEVSDGALTCPHCGARLRRSFASKFFLGTLGVLGTAIVVIAVNYAVTPEYKRKAIQARSACLDFVKAGNGDPLVCERIYDNVLAREYSKAYPLSASTYDKDRREWEQTEQKEAETLKKRCIDDKAQIVKEFSDHAAKREWHRAGLKVYRCAELTDDPDYDALAAKAEKNTK